MKKYFRWNDIRISNIIQQLTNRNLNIPIIYLSVSLLWIFFSDKLSVKILKNEPLLDDVLVLKGFVFVIITTIMIYYLIRRDGKRIKIYYDELRKNEELYRSLYNAVACGVIVQNHDGEITDINPVACEILGITPDKIKGKKMPNDQKQVLHENGTEFLMEEYPAMVTLRTGKPGKNIVMGVFNSEINQHRWILANSEPIFDVNSGGIKAVVATFLDITERKIILDKLINSEHQYRSLFNEISEGFALREIILNENGIPVDYRYLDINNSYEKIIEMNKELIIGKTTSEILPGLGADWMEIYKQVALTGNPSRFERYFKDIDKNLEVIAFRPEKDKLATLVLDITEKKLAEKSLEDAQRALEERIIALTQPVGDVDNLSLRDLFDISEIQAIQDAFSEATGVDSIIIDASGVPLTKHSKSCSLCSDIIRKTEKGLKNCIKSDRTIGKTNPYGPNISQCLTPSLLDAASSISIGDRKIANWFVGQVMDKDADETKMLEYAKEIGADEQEFIKASKQVPRMSREQFQKVCNALYLITRQLSALAVQNIQQAREISKRISAEGKIKKLNEELEGKVIERTEQLEVANKELEGFSYSVSHDLRAPLRAIEGFSRILIEDYTVQLDSEGQRFLNIISKNTEQMGQLIDDLLSFSRMSRVSMGKETIKIDELIKTVFNELTSNIKDRDIKLELKAMPIVFGDYSLLKQVMVNLISNSIKFTRTKEEAIIKAGCITDKGETVYYIKDNGVGFDMKYVDKLFGVFQRLHRADEYEGTGIGLALVQRIIRRHEGRVWAEGKINEGTTIFFTL